MRIFGKRALRRLLIFVLLLVAPVLAAGVSTAETAPPAGFYLAEESPEADRIRQYLLENGFITCETPEAVLEQVRYGKLDCGVVFPADFATRISQGKLEESLQFYAAPSSYSPDLYKSHVAAIVFREYAPYICAAAFEGTSVTLEDVLAKYEDMFSQGYVFSFEVVTAGETPEGEVVKNRNMAIGATAILTFAALFVLAAETADRTVTQMLPRLGLAKSITRVLLPETAVQLVFGVVFAGAGLALAGLPELWLPTALFCVAMWGCGLAFYGILWSAKGIYVLLPVLVIASAALCPVYTDLSILLPWLNNVRLVLPAYWLWCIPENVIGWTAISLGILAGGAACIIQRCRLILKYK